MLQNKLCRLVFLYKCCIKAFVQFVGNSGRYHAQIMNNEKQKRKLQYHTTELFCW